MARLGLVQNVASGSGEAARARRLLEELGAEVVPLAAAAAERGPAPALDRIAVAGGDGSLAPAAALAGRLRLPLAVLPVGTGNDFARELGIPLRLEEACRLAVAGGALRSVDLARVDGRPFLNTAGAGLAAAAAREARPWKRLLGPLAYALGALRAAAVARPLDCRVECDGDERFRGRAWQVLVANSGAFGGGSSIADARLDDGRLHVSVVEAGSRWRLIWYGYALRSGRSSPLTGAAGSARRARLELAGRCALNVDGELTQSRDPVVAFEVEPSALRVVVPPRAASA